jgi:hypothetical protein
MMERIETADRFYAAYESALGEWAYHFSSPRNLESIVEVGLDPARRPAEYGIGGSRDGQIYFSTRPPHRPHDQWVYLRTRIRNMDPQLVGPDDDAICHLGFDEEFGDEADAVHDSWGYTEQGAWVARKALDMDLHDNLYTLLGHGDFSYAGIVESSDLQILLPDGSWRSLHGLNVPGPASSRTGDYQLDRFVSCIYQVEVQDDMRQTIPHAMLQCSERSHGLCCAAAEALSHHFTRYGVRNVVVHAADPHTGSGLPHSWVEIIGDDGRFMVDLTAAQFGIDIWPCVRPMRADSGRLQTMLAPSKATEATQMAPTAQNRQFMPEASG